MITRLLMSLLVLLTLPHSQDKPIVPSVGVVFRAHNCAFAISAPAGWVIDSTRWKDLYGLKAGIYPNDKRAEEFPTILMLIASKQKEGKATLKNLLALSSADSSAKMTEIRDFTRTKDGKVVLARRFDLADESSIQAYVDDEQIVVVFAASRLSVDRREKVITALKELLGSYSAVKSN